MHEKSAKKLKGATLYTVTLVISVMLILMLTAIAMSGATFRRASSEFRNDQTNTTARSVVTTILDSLSDQADDDGETLARNLAEALQDVNSTVTLNVTDDSGSADIPGFGTIESVTFTNIGKDDETGYFIQGSGENIIKVTATVSFGHDKTNTTTYTQYVTNSFKNEAESGGSGGFIAAGGVALSASTAGKFFGEAYTGIDEYAVKNVALFRNPTVLEGGAIFNSSAYFTTNNARIELSSDTGKENGIYVNGNLGFLNPVGITCKYTHSAITKVSDLPYIYVDGACVSQAQFNSEGDAGFNLITGRFLNTKAMSMNLNANVFCYNSDTGYNTITDEAGIIAHMNEGYLDSELDENKVNQLNSEGTDAIDSYFKSNLGISIFDSTRSSLINWASSILTEKSKGNIYSKGSVWLKGGFDLDDVVVGGILYIDPGAQELHIHGNIYADTICVKMPQDPTKLDIQGIVTCNHIIGPQLSGSSSPLPYSIDYYFPEGMASKDEITGNDTNHPQYKIVKTRQDAIDQFYDKDLNKYKNSINVSHLNITTNSKIYYQYGGLKYTTPGGEEAAAAVGSELEIKESCTLAGSFQNVEIRIIPSNGEDLWINLFKVNLENSKIIVDDSDGRVNFFIPVKGNYCDEATATSSKIAYIDCVNSALGYSHTSYGDGMDNTFVGNNTQIYTKRYYEDFLTVNGQTCTLKPINLKTYYSDIEENDSVNGNYVPDIYIYAADNVYKDDDNPAPGTHVSPKIQFINQCAVTGNLVAPYSDFSFKNSAIMGAENNMHYTVAGATGESNMKDVVRVSWIGSVLVGQIEEIQNDFAFFYVSRDPSGTPPGSGDDIYGWDIIQGFATY